MSMILITGVAGFIGFHLANALLAKDHCIIGIDNMNGYYDSKLKSDRLSILKGNKRFSFYKGDLTDVDFINGVFDNSFDIVINLAAQAGVRYSIDSPRTYIDSNVVGFFNVLESCRNNKVSHLIFASSSSVYGNRNDGPFKTSDKVDSPISFYAATKVTNEIMAYTYSHLYNIPTTGLRFFTVYGPWGRPDMAYYKFTKSITENKVINVYNNGNMYRDFTYIDDVVNGIERVMFNPPKKDRQGTKYKIYNLGGSHPEKLLKFIEVLENAIGKQAKIRFLPMQPGDVYMTCADASDFEKDFNFSPTVTIEEGLYKFARWYEFYNNI